MVEAIIVNPPNPNISKKKPIEFDVLLGGCMNAFREVHTAHSLKIRKLEESVSALIIENGRLVETLKEEVAASSSFPKIVKDVVSAYMKENDAEWVKRVLHIIEASSNFRNPLKEICTTFVSAAIPRTVERLIEEHQSPQP